MNFKTSFSLIDPNLSVFILSSILLIISCVRAENCETEIIEGLVYKNDKIYTGKCAFYDDNNGGMISSHQFNNGKFHGKWRFYYPNGQLDHQGSWVEGQKDGLWEYYLEDGKNQASVLYSKGREWKVIEFDRFGQPKNQEEFEKFNQMVANKEAIEAAETNRGKRKLKRKAKREEKKAKRKAKKEAKRKKKAAAKKKQQENNNGEENG